MGRYQDTPEAEAREKESIRLLHAEAERLRAEREAAEAAAAASEGRS